MKTRVIEIKEDFRNVFEQSWNEEPQLNEEFELVNHANGWWGMKVPEEVTFEEFKEDVENILIDYGFRNGSHYSFV